MTDILLTVRAVLDFRLFEMSGSVVTIGTLMTAGVLLIVTVLAASAVSGFVSRALLNRGGKAGPVGSISTLLRYVILVIGIAVALDTAGINLAALFAAGALFAVGLGFAMQSIAQNFVAGVILLVERSIQPGDLLQVEGKVVRVLDMGIRASVARTRDGEDLVIPNAVLIQTTVTNYTLRDSIYRIKVPVGVTYDSDMAVVKDTLTRIAQEVSERFAVEGQAPQVIMTEFGNHAVNWEVAIWVNDPWTARPAISALHEAIWWAFQEKGIVIAFPQLDVHFDAPVTGGGAKAGRSAA
jgi:small-conductance mechanosensitive channel